jgi:hypothetical protein
MIVVGESLLALLATYGSGVMSLDPLLSTLDICEAVDMVRSPWRSLPFCSWLLNSLSLGKQLSRWTSYHLLLL